MLVLPLFFSAYCRNNLCTLQVLAASCQKTLPVAIRPVNTAVARMITPQGHGEGEYDHSPCSRVLIWDFSCLRHPLFFFFFFPLLIPWWSPELRFMSLFVLFLSAAWEPAPHFITPKNGAAASAVWQGVEEKTGRVMWKGSESLWPSALFHFWTVDPFFFLLVFKKFL